MKNESETLADLNTGVVALASVCDGFFDAEVASRDAHPVEAANIPEPYQQLLVHQEHMTTRLNAHYGAPVALRVLEEQTNEDHYARRILLTPVNSDAVVEFGIARLNLSLVSPSVRQDVLKQEIPLGDVLIQHNVMRRIDPKWYFRFGPESPFVGDFSTEASVPVFGRVGIIHCDGAPAIQLLEVVTDARRADG